MLKNRNLIAEHVFNYDDNVNIHIPVNFYRIINNVQNNLHITSNNIVDITPIEYLSLIETHPMLSEVMAIQIVY